MDMLNLIQKDIVHSFVLHVVSDIFIEGMIVQKFFKSKVFKIDFNDIGFIYSLWQQMFTKKLEKRGFAAAAYTWHNLYDVFILVTLKEF